MANISLERGGGEGGGGVGTAKVFDSQGLYLYDHPRIVSFFIDNFIVVERERFSSTN